MEIRVRLNNFSDFAIVAGLVKLGFGYDGLEQDYDIYEITLTRDLTNYESRRKLDLVFDVMEDLGIKEYKEVKQENEDE